MGSLVLVVYCSKKLLGPFIQTAVTFLLGQGTDIWICCGVPSWGEIDSWFHSWNDAEALVLGMMALVSGMPWVSPGICHWSQHLFDRKPLPDCISSLLMHLFENLVKFLKREIMIYNRIIGPRYVLEIEHGWKFLYYFLPESVTIFMVFAWDEMRTQSFTNLYTVLKPQFKRKFLASVKTGKCLLCRCIRWKTFLQTEGKETCEFSSWLWCWALCCGTMSCVPASLQLCLC